MVFPGGVSEPADGSQRWLKLISSFGYTNQDFQAFHHPASIITPIFQENPIQRHIQLRITALRETFEELGLLICSKQHKEERVGKFASVIEDIDTAYWQNRISKNPDDWLVLCEEHKCYPDIWSLYYWSNWLTPAFLPKRFNAAFFIAALNDKPINIENNSEVVDAEWLPPDAVLNSDKILYPPQLYELNRLSHVKDIAELVEFASFRSKYVNAVSYPVFVKTKDGQISLLPGDDLYPINIDYNDNTKQYIDKAILELRENCQTIHRFESTKENKRFVVKNYKPEHHLKMPDQIIPANITV